MSEHEARGAPQLRRDRERPKHLTTAEPGAAAEIVIERREIVAVLTPDESGSSEPSLRAAFIAAADYLSENSHTAHGVQLQFELHGATFRAVMDPS